MRHRVTIENTGESFVCSEDVNLLAAMEQACCHGIPVGCRNGGCGACKVRITCGDYTVCKMNRAVVAAEEEARGCVLACRTYPRGDIGVHVLGRVWQPGRLAAGAYGFEFTWTTAISRRDEEN